MNDRLLAILPPLCMAMHQCSVLVLSRYSLAVLGDSFSLPCFLSMLFGTQLLVCCMILFLAGCAWMDMRAVISSSISVVIPGALSACGMLLTLVAARHASIVECIIAMSVGRMVATPVIRSLLDSKSLAASDPMQLSGGEMDGRRWRILVVLCLALYCIHASPANDAVQNLLATLAPSLYAYSTGLGHVALLACILLDGFGRVFFERHIQPALQRLRTVSKMSYQPAADSHCSMMESSCFVLTHANGLDLFIHHTQLALWGLLTSFILLVVTQWNDVIRIWSLMNGGSELQLDASMQPSLMMHLVGARGLSSTAMLLLGVWSIGPLALSHVLRQSSVEMIMRCQSLSSTIAIMISYGMSMLIYPVSFIPSWVHMVGCMVTCACIWMWDGDVGFCSSSSASSWFPRDRCPSSRSCSWRCCACPCAILPCFHHTHAYVTADHIEAHLHEKSKYMTGNEKIDADKSAEVTPFLPTSSFPLDSLSISSTPPHQSAAGSISMPSSSSSSSSSSSQLTNIFRPESVKHDPSSNKQPSQPDPFTLTLIPSHSHSHSHPHPTHSRGSDGHLQLKTDALIGQPDLNPFSMMTHQHPQQHQQPHHPLSPSSTPTFALLQSSVATLSSNELPSSMLMSMAMDPTPEPVAQTAPSLNSAPLFSLRKKSMPRT